MYIYIYEYKFEYKYQYKYINKLIPFQWEILGTYTIFCNN